MTSEIVPWEHEPISELEDTRELSTAWRTKATDEVQEKFEWRERDIQALRELVQGVPSLSCPLEDAFLLRFLRAQKFDYERALTMLKRYFYMRHRACPQHFQKAVPSLAKDVLLAEPPMQTILEHRDNFGRRIFLFRAGVWNTDKISPSDIFAANFLCLEMMAREVKTQIAGTVVVMDMEGLSFNHIMNISTEYVKAVAGVIQSTFPLRFRAIHIIKESYLFDIIFALIKPFLSDVIRSRIQCHGYDLTKLHEQIRPSILPAEFGGELGPMTNQALVETLMKCEDFFQELGTYGFRPDDDDDDLQTQHPFSGYCLAQDN